MTFAQRFLDLKPGVPVDLTDFIFYPFDHDGTRYLIFSDKSAIVKREGVDSVEAGNPVAIAFEAGKAGEECCYPVGSLEALAFEEGKHRREADSPDAQQRLMDVLSGKLKRFS